MAKQIETFEGIEYERSLLGQVEPANNGAIAPRLTFIKRAIASLLTKSLQN
ncbi:hypothetical protein [Nostoc sphaeroides]|uniref:Uncharacterized protein n=1 Tax=Nostoc sphaeroides CCNUC1 TaxID=2653204 RepID=A0A5P8WIW0_9NOSO|nr:hypothetical protein [Nostoc sphaeroides]QFS52758.1 hypothetical protein GXM_10022 [Nostoc sphaeroides CCNUC1]